MKQDHSKTLAGYVCLLFILACINCIAAEETAIRWEAESATATDMKTDGQFKPANATQKQVLSGGIWLNDSNKENKDLFAQYTINVPQESTYKFYVRKFWHHGPFRYRFDDQKWVEAIGTPKIVDHQEMAQNTPACWVYCGEVKLSAGEHTFRLELINRAGAGYIGNYGFDSFLLYTGNDYPAGINGFKENRFAALKKMHPMPEALPQGWKPTIIVDNASPTASDSNSGTKETPLKTINAAAAKANSGDIILVMPGVYRELVVPQNEGTADKPIRYIASEPGKVIIRGSEIWTPEWKQTDKNNLYIADMSSPLFPKEGNPFNTAISIAPKDPDKRARPADEKNGLLPRTLGQIFVNGVLYTQARQTTMVKDTPGSWIVTPEGKSIMIHFKMEDLPIEKSSIEVSVRKQIFAPAKENLGYIEVKGFTLEHCANQGPFPKYAALNLNGGHHWRVNNNTIRFANTIGVDCGSRNHFAVNNIFTKNTISDNGLCGMAGINHVDTIVRNNVFERNNLLDFDHPEAKWAEWAGIKFHICQNVLIEGNLIRNNEGFGIWFDNQYQNVRVTRNVILNNSMAGVFFELGDDKALVDNNIIAHTRRRGHHYSGDGIYTHDASGLTVANNLIYANAGDGIRMITLTNRNVGGHFVDCSRQRIFNNIIYGNNMAAIDLPYPNKFAKENRSDYNLLFGTQEFWEGMDNWPMLMAVNRFKNSATKESMHRDIMEKLRKKQIPEDQWPNFSTWFKNPALSLKHWQAIMSQDLHSIESFDAIKVHLLPGQNMIELEIKKSFFDLRCPKVPQTTTDFQGNEIPKASGAAGPFQNLKEGVNQFGLWPVPKATSP